MVTGEDSKTDIDRGVWGATYYIGNHLYSTRFFTPLRPQHSKISQDYRKPKKISKMYKYTFWGNVYLLTKSEERWGEEGENNEILPSITCRWPEGAFTMHRGRRKLGWTRAAGMWSMLIHLLFLRGCALANDGLLTCSTGWSTEQEKVFGTISGIMSQSTKMTGCHTAQKEGRRGWKCWTEGKKRLLIQKN